MRHSFEKIGDLQWAALGLPYESARTEYRCRRCGKKFTHFYHIEPSIYKAMENAGIKIDDCKGVKEDRPYVHKR